MENSHGKSENKGKSVINGPKERSYKLRKWLGKIEMEKKKKNGVQELGPTREENRS